MQGKGKKGGEQKQGERGNVSKMVGKEDMHREQAAPGDEAGRNRGRGVEIFDLKSA